MSQKLFKSELKSIVKECLVEILSEGLLGQKQQVSKPLAERTVNKAIRSRPKKVNKDISKSINTNLTDNSIINEILADTANTTLQEHIAADSKRGGVHNIAQGDHAARIVNNSSPEELFGGNASKWASLAFSK